MKHTPKRKEKKRNIRERKCKEIYETKIDICKRKCKEIYVKKKRKVLYAKKRINKRKKM